eukprot:scaffold2261_cov405-Prasinococcus_capsulatus_cf.AAC.6
MRRVRTQEAGAPAKRVSSGMSMDSITKGLSRWQSMAALRAVGRQVAGREYCVLGISERLTVLQRAVGTRS